MLVVGHVNAEVEVHIVVMMLPEIGLIRRTRQYRYEDCIVVLVLYRMHLLHYLRRIAASGEVRVVLLNGEAYIE